MYSSHHSNWHKNPSQKMEHCRTRARETLSPIVQVVIVFNKRSQDRVSMEDHHVIDLLLSIFCTHMRRSVDIIDKGANPRIELAIGSLRLLNNGVFVWTQSYLMA